MLNVLSIVICFVFATSSAAQSATCPANMVLGGNGKCVCAPEYELVAKRCVKKSQPSSPSGTTGPISQEDAERIAHAVLGVFPKLINEYRYQLSGAAVIIFLRYIYRLGIDTQAKVAARV